MLAEISRSECWHILFVNPAFLYALLCLPITHDAREMFYAVLPGLYKYEQLHYSQSAEGSLAAMEPENWSLQPYRFRVIHLESLAIQACIRLRLFLQICIDLATQGAY